MKILLFFLLCIIHIEGRCQVTPPPLEISSLNLSIKTVEGKEFFYRTHDKYAINRICNISINLKETKHNSVYESSGIPTGFNQTGAFKNGYKTGLWKTTYEGKVIKTENWDNGLIIGKYRIYDTQGNLLYQTNFGSLGNGKYKDYYYKTNTLKQEGNYENGKKEGEWCDYNNQGKLIKTTKYKNGLEQTI